jgi:Protein of unknown function (DUF4239)
MNLWFAVFVITVCVVIVLVIVYFARKRVPGGGLFTDSNWAAAAFGVLGTSFAVLLAFVIFLAFESYANAKERSSAEAVAVTELYRDAKLFSDPTGSEVRGQLICYARAVIHDEWPAMREQRTSPAVEKWIERLDATVDAASLAGSRQEIGYSSWLDRMVERREGRRGRLGEAAPFVPAPLWAMLLVAAALLIGYMCLYADPSEKFFVQAFVIGALTAITIAGILIVRFLDKPYEGQAGSIRPVEMTRTLALMEEQRELTHQPTAVPCDNRGIPLDA